MCSGASRFAHSRACLRDVAMRIAPRRRNDSWAIGLPCASLPTLIFTARASLREVVTKTESVSGSCSACATRSAAMKFGFPELVDLRNALGAVGQGRDCLRSTDPEELAHAEHCCGAQNFL